MKYNYQELTDVREAAERFEQQAEAAFQDRLDATEDALAGFVCDVCNDTDKSALFRRLRREYLDGAPASELLTTQLDWLFGSFIHERRRACLLYAVDNCHKWAFARNYTGRRSYRTRERHALFGCIRLLLHWFMRWDFVDREALDILRGEVGEDERAYLARAHKRLPSCLIAWEIDRGNEAFIAEVRECILGNAAAWLDGEMILGILQSSSAELHGLLGQLLLAARLQEGLRQAICEQADMGTLAGFLEILRVIHDNGLIRYSSVKRALGVWTGLIASFHDCRAADLERISEKTEALIWEALDNPAAREAFVRSEDSMQIHLGLWAYGTHELADCVARIEGLACEGSHHQVLTAGYTAEYFCEKRLRHRAACAVIERHRSEPDILAVWLPSFMPRAFWDFDDNLRRSKGGQRSRCPLREFFADEQEAARWFDILLGILEGIKGKSPEFKPCIFPWHSARLEKHRLVCCLGWIASALDDNARIDRVLDFLDDADYYREELIAQLLPYPQTEKQRRVLVERLGDKREDARKKAYAVLTTRGFELEPAHYLMLEDMLRYKNAGMRANLIKLLLAQADGALAATVARLLADKKEEKRSAGLDIILQLGKDKARQELYGQCSRLAEQGSYGSTKEEILVSQIVPEAKEVAPEAPYDESDSYEPVVDADYLARAEAVFRKYFCHQGVMDRLRGRKPDFEPVNEKLAAFMQEHADDEFKASYGGTCTLGTGSVYMRWEEDGSYTMPLAGLWDAFYEQEIASPVLLLRAYVAAVAEGDYDECASLSSKVVAELLGKEFTQRRPMPMAENVADVYRYWCEKYGNREELELIAAHVAHQLTQRGNLKLTYRFKGYRGGMQRGASSLLECYQFEVLLAPLDEGCRHDIAKLFPICYALEQVPGRKVERKGDWRSGPDGLMLSGYSSLDAEAYIRAAHAGVISGRFLCRRLMEPLKGKDDEMNALYYLSCIARGDKAECRSLAKVEGLLDYARGVYDKLVEAVLWEELRRGDHQTPYSRHIFRLRRIFGAQYYVRALAALGREPLSRQRGRYLSQDEDNPKAECLSHLLEVCVPAEGDTAAGFAALLKGTDIREERLIEAAMYSPEWLELTQEYLQWPGLASACLYFIAHTSADFDKRREALIARYTPLTKDELNNGAFGIDWFRRAHEELGHKRFELVYKAAKYSADGARHTRARKYADAATGKLAAAATQAEIAAKRNKDLLMAYALIPLADEAELLARYLFIRQFEKESRRFGAQRMASEKLAAGMALRNLATNAGMADVTRLTLRMETKLLESTRPLLEEKALGEYSVRLAVDGQGRAEILCSKGGKQLKAVPAKLKKEAHMQLLAETKAAFNEQQARTRRMLEESMEDSTAYSFGELTALLDNPVVAPMLRQLLWIGGEACGLLAEGGLVDVAGSLLPLAEADMLRPAHPFDLYRAKSWADWQRLLFGRGIVQPFRQVFRELYVKTPDELDANESRRYSGYQVQPVKAAACLRARRWVADYEAGLQKVSYGADVVVRLCARADWFTPSDIEAPAIEWVEFIERRSGKPLAIEAVPDILFSECMRDIDLAVSVAHVGGVDPETSHSTIEMRAALLRFTLPLFKLTNVELKGSHAHITGTRADYTLHLGSGIVHQKGGAMLNILPVHSQHRGRLFLPFADDDPKTAEIISKALLLAEDHKLQDPGILRQLNR